jgi:hypothetical protein
MQKTANDKNPLMDALAFAFWTGFKQPVQALV